LILDEKEVLITQTEDWETIFKRLNAIVLGMRSSIFIGDIEDKKDDLNLQSQMLSFNVNMIHGLIERQEINDDEIPENIKNVFRLHIEFETFIYTDFREEVEKTDDFNELKEFLKQNYNRIYSELSMEEVITTFSNQGEINQIDTPRKFKSKSSNHWSERGSTGNGYSRSDSLANTPGWGSNKRTKPDNSVKDNSMTFKKKDKPEKETFDVQKTIGEEDFPDIEEMSIKTDSELEELQKNKQKFRAMEGKTDMQKKFADVLGFDEEDKSEIASR
jgi:hypothetical protein